MLELNCSAFFMPYFQVDNRHYDIPYININSISKIEIVQLPTSSSNFDNNGCISGLCHKINKSKSYQMWLLILDIGISYKIDSDGDSRTHSSEGRTVNVIDEILHNINGRNQLRFTKECGIRDNNVWMSPISPADFGIVGAYNPFGIKRPAEILQSKAICAILYVKSLVPFRIITRNILFAFSGSAL